MKVKENNCHSTESIYLYHLYQFPPVVIVEDIKMTIFYFTVIVSGY